MNLPYNYMCLTLHCFIVCAYVIRRHKTSCANELNSNRPPITDVAYIHSKYKCIKFSIINNISNVRVSLYKISWNAYTPRVSIIRAESNWSHDQKLTLENSSVKRGSHHWSICPFKYCLTYNRLCPGCPNIDREHDFKIAVDPKVHQVGQLFGLVLIPKTFDARVEAKPINLQIEPKN